MKLNQDDYRNKVLGCWLGKNVGGTLGAPFEWARQVNDVSFYTQKDLNGQPMPNDDLDIQLALAHCLGGKGHRYHRPPPCGILVPLRYARTGLSMAMAKINMRQGLQPPLSGTLQNDYKHKLRLLYPQRNLGLHCARPAPHRREVCI